MPRISIKNSIREIFDKNPKREFTEEEMKKYLDERYALVPKGKKNYLIQLTREGFLIRRKNENKVYAYRKRGKIEKIGRT